MASVTPPPLHSACSVLYREVAYYIQPVESIFVYVYFFPHPASFLHREWLTRVLFNCPDAVCVVSQPWFKDIWHVTEYSNTKYLFEY